MRDRLTYANVVSTLCLFILLGGGAYAAVTLPSNSVGNKQIRRNAVTGAKVKNNSLTGRDIDESTLVLIPRVAEAAHSKGAAEALGKRTGPSSRRPVPHPRLNR